MGQSDKGPKIMACDRGGPKSSAEGLWVREDILFFRLNRKQYRKPFSKNSIKFHNLTSIGKHFKNWQSNPGLGCNKDIIRAAIVGSLAMNFDRFALFHNLEKYLKKKHFL